MFTRFVSYLMLAITGIAYSAEPNSVHLVTEDAFPLQYMQDGKLEGFAADKVETALTQAGIPYSIDVLPWARAYQLALNVPNTLIFSMARTQERENSFIWLSSLMKTDYKFYGLKEHFQGKELTFEQIKNLRIGVIRDSATYHYLIKKKLSTLYPVSHPSQNYEKLFSGRIDVFTANKESFHASCEQFKSDCDEIEELIPVGIAPTELFMAINIDSDPKLIKRIQLALNNVGDKVEQ